NSASFAFRLVTTDEDPKVGRPLGLAISTTPHEGFFVPLPEDDATTTALLQEFRPVLENEKVGKVGHALKSDLGFLKCYGIEVRGTIFDTMIAHSLIEPDQRHTFTYLAESLLGYSSIAPAKVFGDAKSVQLSLAPRVLADY